MNWRETQRILMWIPSLFWLFPCGGGDGAGPIVTIVHAIYSTVQIVTGVVCTILVLCGARIL